MWVKGSRLLERFEVAGVGSHRLQVHKGEAEALENHYRQIGFRIVARQCRGDAV